MIKRTAIIIQSWVLLTILTIALAGHLLSASELSSITGEARKALLGPVDEHLGYKPVPDMPIMIIPFNIIKKTDLVNAHENKSQLFCQAYDLNPETIHLRTDINGIFSYALAQGSYYLCAAYKLPWNQTWSDYAYKRVKLKANKQVELLIIYNPDWRGLRIIEN